MTLARYVVHEEDDGFGGHGVDLYMGYLMSGAASGGGTTPVMGGLTKNNGGQPRNTHEMQQALFTVPLPAAGAEGEFAVARLHLIESDQTSGLIQQAFNSAVVPAFSTVAPPHLTQADLPIFYLVPMGFIVRLLAESNTDDDYGHWDLIFWSQNGVVGCKAMGGTPECSANPAWCVITPAGKTQIVLSYVDNENDIDCVIELSLTYSHAAAIQRKQQEQLKEQEQRQRDAEAPSARGLESVLSLLKEALKEDNETKKYKLEKLRDLNTLNKALSDQLEKIVEASEQLAAKEKESGDTPGSLGTELRVAGNLLEEIRNKKREFQTAFDHIDKQNNETMNTISRVLRALGEMRQEGAAKRGGL